jgi:uncharacterized FAD-dependent dehydrogenase
MIFDYVFIGGGVANLAAANYLFDSGASKILVIEKGLLASQRHCPGAKKDTCVHCRNVCHVVEGLGGSNALFGNKLCYFPASDGVLQTIQKETLSRAACYLESLLAPYFSAKYITQNPSCPPRKNYYSDVLSRREFAEMIAQLTRRLHADGVLQIKSDVAEVRKTAGGFFAIMTREGLTINSANVIVGTGRSSQYWFREVLRSLRVAYSEQAPDVGIRIESDAESFGESYYYQIDPKFKFEFPPYGSARTFCAHNRGVVVPVQLGGAFYADGAFPTEFTNKNNIALMTRAHDPISLQDLEQWCGDVNRFTSNSLVITDIEINTCDTALNNAATILSTIPSWPSYSHQKLMSLLIQRLLAEPIRFLRSKEALNTRLRIYAPAIDRFWPIPELGENFETSCPGLFIVGDAAGLSRGFVQAMISGVSWALDHHLVKSARAPRSICSASV